MKSFITVAFVLLAMVLNAQSSTLAIADSLYAVGNYYEAIQNLKNIEDKSETVYSKLAKAYIAKGDLSSALKNICISVLSPITIFLL